MSASSRGSLFGRARRRVQPGSPETTDPSWSTTSDPDSEVTNEQTNIGPMMDGQVLRAQQQHRPLGVDPDYDLVREHFDFMNYLLDAQLTRDVPGPDPVRHFLRKGSEAVNSPNYNFSMQGYLARHPDRSDGPERSPYLTWLKHGQAAGEIADPASGIEMLAEVLDLSPRQVVDELVATRTDMMERLRTGELGRMFAKAAEIEPLVGEQWAETIHTRMLPLGGEFVVGMVAALHACQAQAGFQRARLLIVTDELRSGGDRPFESYLAQAVATTLAAEDIVVVYTDELPSGTARWLPEGVREVDFAGATVELPDEHRQQALVSLLRSFGADAIVNAGSRCLYRSLAPYGKALAASDRIYLAFSSTAQRPAGHWDGWSLRWFYASYDFAAGFIVDSESVRDQLSEMYQLSESDLQRVHVLRTPVDPAITPAAPRSLDEPPRRPVVHWAGRKSRRRRMDIALEVARRMPDVDFRLWDLAGTVPDTMTPLPGNVVLEGLPGQIADLDLSQADAWLDTSAWGGVSSILVDVAMRQIPIVASLVDGVAELLSDDASTVVDRDDPGAYVQALGEVLADPAAAFGRSRGLRERLERDRAPQDFSERAVAVLLDETVRAGDRP